MITYKKINMHTLSQWMFEFHGPCCPFMPIGIGHPQGHKQDGKKSLSPLFRTRGRSRHPSTLNQPTTFELS